MTGGDREAGARCPACAALNPDGARFCVACGARFGGEGCPSCGAELVPGGHFCPSCGYALDEGATSAVRSPDAEPAAEPDRIGLSERRHVSIVFVDLVDSTAIAESMDPEEVRSVQARYFEVARSVVAAHGGTIEKFIGDAVMAVWGAPTAHEDDAERAVRAALSIVDGVERLGGAAVGRALRARAAVASGEAAVTIGAVNQGIVAGDLVNVAARLQGRAPPGGIVVDRTTRDATSAVVTYARVGKLALRGRSGRLETFRATGLRDDGSVRGASHGGRLVGRDHIVREITTLMQDVVDSGRGRLVSVTGIAGIGKSRLAWELDRWVEARPDVIAWHEGRALAYGEGIAFWALAQMVRRRARIDESAPPELTRRQLSSAMEELVRDDAERRWIEPRLATLLTPQSGDRFDRDELFAAWRRFFEHVSELTPVVMIFEDLQWADPSLLDFVEHLATWSRERPIFILALARPELLDARPTWGSGVGRFTAITLDRLPDDAMRMLLAERAPDLDASLVDSILQRAGGVPLYAVEVARMLLESMPRGRRAREHEELRPGGSDVPDSLQGVITTRLDALPPAERRILLSASVLGTRFRPDVLHSVVGGDGENLRERLDGLVRREMLAVDEELGSPGRGQLSFVQELVRDVAYRTLARSERRTLHLAAARYFESAEVDAPDALAAHLVAALRLTTQPRDAERVANRALGALRRAARGAMLLHVPAHAEDLLETAVELANDANRPSVLGEAADAARAAGHLERAIALLRERAALEQEAGDRTSAARTLARLASVLLVAQANEPALRELEAALGGIRRWQSDPAGIELAAQLARAHSVLGDDREALRWADRALPAARRLDLRAVGTELRITRATAQLSLGDPDSGLDELRGAIAEAQEGELLRAELRARNNLAWGLLADDPLAAGDTARQGLGLATEMGIGDFLVPLADLACSAALEAGSWDWALATAEAEVRGSGGTYRVVLTAVSAVIRALRGERAAFAALDVLEPLPPDTDSQLLAVCGLARAWQYFLAGDLDGARERADRAIVDAPNLPLHELALAIRIRLWQGDREAATTTLATLADPSRWGRAADAARRTMEAGIAALHDDPRAGGLYREAIEGWERLSLPLQRTLCLLDRQRLLPDASDEHELREAIAALGADGLAGIARPAARKRRTQKAGARPAAGARHP